MPLLNLLMALDKGSGMKQKTEAIIDKVVSFTNIPTNGTVVIGDSMFSGQLYTSGTNSTTIRENAVTNGLPIYDTAACDKVLKEFYNLTDNDEILYLTGGFNPSLNQEAVSTYKITAYDGQTKQKLNMDLCQNISQTVELPLNSNTTEFNLTQYNEMKEAGIDIFDPEDPFFTDRCATFNSTGDGTSLSWRRKNLYQKKQPMCIGFSCTFEGISAYNYIKCNCTGLKTDIEMFNKLVDTIISSISKLNVGIITCYTAIPVTIELLII
jgi:hypothetical protein